MSEGEGRRGDGWGEEGAAEGPGGRGVSAAGGARTLVAGILPKQRSRSQLFPGPCTPPGSQCSRVPDERRPASAGAGAGAELGGPAQSAGWGWSRQDTPGGRARNGSGVVCMGGNRTTTRSHHTSTHSQRSYHTATHSHHSQHPPRRTSLRAPSRTPSCPPAGPTHRTIPRSHHSHHPQLHLTHTIPRPPSHTQKACPPAGSSLQTTPGSRAPSRSESRCPTPQRSCHSTPGPHRSLPPPLRVQS